MKNLQLKKNIEHIYAMGGSIRTKHPNAYCSKNSTSSCGRQQCGNTGNLYTDFTSNPCAEFNMFADPFAAYQAVHSGIPITLIPLDATNTIPISKEFFEIFEKNQKTYEAQYCFSSLKIARDTWPGDQFYKSYSSWDSFASSIAVSIMHNSRSRHGENKIAEMEYMNITVVTSNEPYGVTDCSNPFFHMQEFPRFHLKEGGVHSGHVQNGLRDPFCIVKNGAGRCKDGCTEEVAGPEGVPVLVATKAKFNKDKNNPLNKVFFISFLDSLNRPEHAGRFNFTTQFPYYKEVLYKPDFRTRKLGKPIVFDMDMSAGDFLALFYLLKVPVEVINLKAILVTPTGWANAATIDVVYDLLHMMGRDDIPVGLGDMFAMNQSDPVFSVVGNCKYVKAIPHGSGGYLDSDTLYGLARDLPRSPRRYTAHNSVKYGAPRDTDHPELRQPSALEIWASVVETLEPGSSVTILTNGPLTTLAKISRENTTRYIKDVYVVGGNIMNHDREDGNVFTVESNKYAEFNLFLDPLAAKTVFESGLAVKLIPLSIQRRINSFELILQRLNAPSNKTPEAFFAGNVLSSLHRLKILRNERYRHVDAFLGETLGAVLLAAEVTHLNPRLDVMPIKVLATGDESSDGQIIIDTQNGKPVGVFEDFNATAFYDIFASRLLDEKQSASVGSFDEQRRRWSSAPDENN